MAGHFFLGTSGFAYPEWKGDFYPTDIKPDAMLRYYAERFPSVEINYTFQRNPSEKMLAKWTRDTPDGFVFSLKANRAITHNRRLKPEAAEPLTEFLRSIEPLGDRTGPVLFQCPPSFKADNPRLEAFVDILPEARRYAFEFRHETCDTDEVRGILAKRGIAWCVADTDERDAAFIRTAPAFGYLRLRKTMYDDEALSRWAKDIGEALADDVDVYCYLKHEDEGRGVHFARRLADLVEDDSPDCVRETTASEGPETGAPRRGV